eukprot:scaffold133261_cov65-Cyclotella_meneghiniana.AAC.1
MSIIHRCMMQLFVKAPATFISQWQFNSKANLMSRIAKGKSIEKKAAETSKMHLEADKLRAENAALKKKARKTEAKLASLTKSKDQGGATVDPEKKNRGSHR